MKNVKFILLLSLWLVGCDANPSIAYLEENFFKNKDSFFQISKLACRIGETNQKSSDTAFRYVYNESVSNEEKNPLLDKLLTTIGSSSIIYDRGESGICTLTVVYLNRAFANSGVRYSYTFQKTNLNVKTNGESDLDDLFEKNERNTIDIPLDNHWHISIRKS